MQRFQNLKVWQRGHEFALSVYRLSLTFPREERYGLTSQLRRAALSVPTNIAEGSKKHTAADYGRFLNIAEGSIGEAEYLLLFARDMGYADSAAIGSLIGEATGIARMLSALRSRVEAEP